MRQARKETIVYFLTTFPPAFPRPSFSEPLSERFSRRHPRGASSGFCSDEAAAACRRAASRPSLPVHRRTRTMATARVRPSAAAPRTTSSWYRRRHRRCHYHRRPHLHLNPRLRLRSVVSPRCGLRIDPLPTFMRPSHPRNRSTSTRLGDGSAKNRVRHVLIVAAFRVGARRL